MQIYAELDPDPQHCKNIPTKGANPDQDLNHWINIPCIFIKKVNFNTNLFQVKGSPIPPPCHPRHSCAMPLTRCGLAAEMWPVQCALSAVCRCQAQELRWHAGNVANSQPTARTANVMAPRHLNSIRVKKNIS
jgi:hypothetical protein